MPAISASALSVSTGSLPVGIYARVSTFNQVGGRFDSCESQAVMCRDYLNKHAAAEGWHEFITLTDAAYSGANLNRPGMQVLMHHIEAGTIKVVLIFKLERVLRSTHEWVPFRAFLRKHGCRLVSATEDISDETPPGRLKNNIVMSVNEYERDNTSEKIHLKLVEQAKRGMWTGGNVPYGYTYDAELQGLKPLPEEAERAPLRAKLTELDHGLAELTQQLRHCAQAVARGGIDFLGDALREEAAALHQKKQALLVEREQARQDLAACEQRSLDPERVRRSLARFGELMPTLSPEQQRDLLLLFLEKVEVRPAVKPAPDACARHIELRLKVRVHRLIEGMEDRLVIDAGDRGALPTIAATRPLLLQTEVAVRQAGGVALLSPFARTLLTSKTATTPKPAPSPVQHPLHRARAWQRRFEAEPKLKRIDLAAAEGLTPGAITHCMKLLQLVPAIQERLLNLSTPAEIRRFSLNQMKALAELPPDEQLLRFAALENGA